MLTKIIYLIIVAVFILILLGLMFFKQHSTNPTMKNSKLEPPNLSINETIPENNPYKGLFPEHNQPPYLYVPMGNNWVSINKEWKIRLDSIVSDNRCPTGNECVVAGSATVKIQFMQPGVDYSHAYYETITVQGMNRFPLTGELKEGLFHPIEIKRTDIHDKQIGFKLTLVDLHPYPDKNMGSELAKNYVGLFKIESLK